MGRTSACLYLTSEYQESVRTVIRSQQYVILDLMMASLQERGIKGISRSSLHRNGCQLKEADALCASTGKGTVVTNVERGSGEVRVMKTSALGLSIATMLEKIQGTSVLS